MILRLLPLALSVIVLSPGLLLAQQGPGGSAPATAGPRADHQMYEDIEIMRHILDRKLLPLYTRTNYVQSIGAMMGMQGGMMGMQGGMMGMQGGMMGMLGMPNNPIWHQEICQTLEGAYLKGQGIVYTATLSSLKPAAKVETAGPPDSEWESVRRELHNVKETPKKPAAKKPAALPDVLLKVLAENSRHLSQLGENESLTIVLTVHEANPPSPLRKTTGRGSGVAARTGSPSPNVAGSTDLRDKVSDLELLGDLHQKQGHFVEAVNAYKKAVAVEPRPKSAPTIYCKLAQCYLALGWDENARKTLDEISALLKESAGAKDKPAPAAKVAVALPVKLIISAPKRLLDQVTVGKISFEEFRRRASVETLTFGKAH